MTLGGLNCFMRMTNTTRESPLHYAASCGNIEILESILAKLEAGQIQVGVNTQSAIGWSPLLTASARGHLKCVELMLRVPITDDAFLKDARLG